MEKSSIMKYGSISKPTRGDNIIPLNLKKYMGLVSNFTIGPEFDTNYHVKISFNINLEVYKENLSE